MSQLGDVIWADGRSWTKTRSQYGGLNWLAAGAGEGQRAYSLALDLKSCTDFAWLVHNGQRAVEEKKAHKKTKKPRR